MYKQRPRRHQIFFSKPLGKKGRNPWKSTAIHTLTKLLSRENDLTLHGKSFGIVRAHGGSEE